MRACCWSVRGEDIVAAVLTGSVFGLLLGGVSLFSGASLLTAVALWSGAGILAAVALLAVIHMQPAAEAEALPA
jgi:hypothetical protein